MAGLPLSQSRVIIALNVRLDALTARVAALEAGGTPTPPPVTTRRFAFNVAANSQYLGAL